MNETKTAVARPQEGSFSGSASARVPEVKRVIAPKTLDRFKRRIREITRRAKGVSMNHDGVPGRVHAGYCQRQAKIPHFAS
jgi:RNA-directed DNA polymerase